MTTDQRTVFKAWAQQASLDDIVAFVETDNAGRTATLKTFAVARQAALTSEAAALKAVADAKAAEAAAAGVVAK